MKDCLMKLLNLLLHLIIVLFQHSIRVQVRVQDIQGADFTLGMSLFGAVKLNKNADSDKCFYYGYGIGLDTRGSCSLYDDSGI